MITKRFEAPKPIEIWGSLSIRDYPRMGGPIRHRVAQLELKDCKAGDVVNFSFAFEVTNEQGYAVELTGKIVLTQEQYPSINGIAVTSERGYNVTPQVDMSGNVFHGMHHGIDSRSNSCVIPEDGDYWLAAIYYAGGSSYTQPSEALKVEGGYGDFTAIRFRS